MATSTPSDAQHATPAFHISSIGDSSVSMHANVEQTVVSVATVHWCLNITGNEQGRNRLYTVLSLW